MAQDVAFGRRGARAGAGDRGVAPRVSSPRRARLRAAFMVLGVIGCGGGIMGGREAAQALFAHRTPGAIDRQADIERLARAGNRQLSTAEAVSQYAHEAAPKLVGDGASERAPAVMAAATFFGFYHVNLRSRVEYCARLGVDITPFTSLFARNHRREYERALAIAAEAGTSEEAIWSMVRPRLAMMVRTDMEAVASRLTTTPRGACEAIVTRADEFADRLAFATLQPDVRRILLGL